MGKGGLTKDIDDLVKLSFFVEIGKAIVKAKTIDETLQVIMRQIGEIFTPLNWSIMLKNSYTGELTFTAVVGKNSEKLQGLRLPKGEGVAGWIAETGQSVIVEDVSKDSRFSSRVDRFTGFETESIIGVPLTSNNKVFGVIELINKLDGEPFTAFDLKLLKSIADFAAIAIEKSYYFRALKRLASTDALTGVHNRGYFDRVYARELELCKRYKFPLSIILVDVDNFKSINDNYGHLNGDVVLKNLADLLVNCVRKVDVVCRYGGDEFIVLMPNTTSQDSTIVKERILRRIKYQNSLNPDVSYNVSIGMYSVKPGEDVDVFSCADSDLYQEKYKKLNKDIDLVEEHLEDMLKDERSTLTPSAKNRYKTH